MSIEQPDQLPLKPIIYTEANPTVLRIVPELAEEIGLSESIVLLQIAYWISKSYNLRDGRWWTYQSLADMQEKAFSFWERSTVARIVERLVERGLIVVGNYNERKGDKTQWFALHIENVQALRSIALMLEVVSPDAVAKRNRSVAKRNSKLQNATTLPENTIDNTENNSTPNGDGKALTPIVSMKNAIKAAFYPDKTDKQVTKSEWGVIQAAAKQLIDAEALPEHIPALYAYCLGKFTTFTAMAMASHLNNWRNTLPRANGNGAHTPPAQKLTQTEIDAINAELDAQLAPKNIFGNPTSEE